jgi:hypothetical protein
VTIGVLLLTAACGSDDPRGTGQSGRLVVPEVLPGGWYVTSARSTPTYEEQVEEWLYARPGWRRPGDGPALVVGRADEDAPLPYGEDPELRGRWLVSHQSGTVMFATNDGDAALYVVGRGVPEAAVERAANSANFFDRGVPLPRASVPRGFTVVADGPSFTELATQTVTLRRTSTGGSRNVWSDRIQLRAYDVTSKTSALLEFWTPIRERDDLPGAARRLGRTIVTVDGGPDRRTVERILRGLQTADAAAWVRFQRDSLEIPAAALAPCGPDHVSIADTTGEKRWAVSFPTPGSRGTTACVSVHRLDGAETGAVSAGTTTPPTAVDPQTITILAAMGANGDAIIGGSAPPSTTKVAARSAEGREATAVLDVAVAGVRPFGLFLPDTQHDVTIIAYDRAGRELARARTM